MVPDTESSTIQPILPSDKVPEILPMAKHARVIGVIGIICCFLGIIFGIAAVTLGILSLKKIKHSQGLYTGKKHAIHAIVLGIIGILIWIPIFYDRLCCFRSAQIRSTVSQVKAEQQTIATALESYYRDNHVYPKPDFDEHGRPIVPYILTTPVAYLSKLLNDPFKDKGKGYYEYGCDTGRGWIVTSYGPDRVDGNSGISGGHPLYQFAFNKTLI